MAKVVSCNAGEGAQKVGTILPLSYQALSRIWEPDNFIMLYVKLQNSFPDGKIVFHNFSVHKKNVHTIGCFFRESLDFQDIFLRMAVGR